MHLCIFFQTDSRGYYTPFDSAQNKMGEPDARLFGFLKTDANGNFEIHTIRPASYPKKYEGRTIPQHIHNNITAKGYANQNLQMVFDDDPAMNDYWRQWATGKWISDFEAR
jgi:protocatechuate 3,4-dioxygenase beta subunit